MEPKNVLGRISRGEFREWLSACAANEPECWVEVRKGRPSEEEGCLWYVDAVEEALCFGWIDSTLRRVAGASLQRFSPRRSGSPWTELNKARVRRLERLGLMTDAGRAVLPPMDPELFRPAPEVERALREAGAWEAFCSFPPLYQRVRAYNVAFYLGRDRAAYEKALANLIERTLQGRLYGEWNDYGRLDGEG